MEQILRLLADKNQWYAKYQACTEAFIAALKHAPDVALDEIELFYGNRESLLKILDSIDQKIQPLLAQEERMGTEINSTLSTKLQYFLREKDSIVAKIIQLDKEMMEELEILRAKGEEKLKLLAKGKKALAKYKSGPQANDRIDKRA